ncbi:MAG: prolyl oligopeptidase family serine peptidase [Planctomycetota bacterium]
MVLRCLVLLILLCTVARGTAHSQEVANAKPKYKSLPPVGIELPEAKRKSLARRIAQLRERYPRKRNPAYTADIEVISRAVELALEDQLFFKPNQIDRAEELLNDAEERWLRLTRGQTGLRLLGIEDDKNKETQRTYGGFRSSLDGSIQPYGLVIPAGFKLDDGKSGRQFRLDVWLHGRGDTKTEIPFLWERRTSDGQYTPEDTIVLHPFGRHCNAFKFAGEMDVFEAIQHIQRLIPIDTSRINLRGFSMGGAGVWHLGVHHPTFWKTINPGAGFVDTVIYQGWDKKPEPYPLDSLRKRLMNWYDVLPYATNLKGTNVIAYSGEVDKQRQAAERVTQVLRDEGIKYEHILGKDMGHKIDKPSKQIIDRWIADRQLQSPLNQPFDFTTAHLRYHRIVRISISGLTKHLDFGRIRGEWKSDYHLRANTSGISHLRIRCKDESLVTLELDEDVFEAEPEKSKSSDSYFIDLGREKNTWQPLIDEAIRKRPGTCGPIDDAFCGPIVFVRPSRPASHGSVQRFIDREMKFAIRRWREIMRGDVTVVDDTKVTPALAKSANLICFGDLESNEYLRSIANELPIQWTKDKLDIKDQSFAPETSVPVMIYPNPRSPNRYVVINSGMTFREFSNVSNSRQIAMLGDWAVFDATSPSNGIFAGEILAEGIFDEQWK